MCPYEGTNSEYSRHSVNGLGVSRIRFGQIKYSETPKYRTLLTVVDILSAIRWCPLFREDLFVEQPSFFLSFFLVRTIVYYKLDNGVYSPFI